jgi:acyl-CoA thioesterase-2
VLWRTSESPFDLAYVGGSAMLSTGAHHTDRQMVWLRTRRHVPSDEQLLHRALLAYACDLIMLEPVLRRAGQSMATATQEGLAVASLDHAMWWHREVRIDDWLLFSQEAPSAQGGRGLGFAYVFDRDGRHIASIGQEGMIRLPAIDG